MVKNEESPKRKSKKKHRRRRKKKFEPTEKLLEDMDIANDEALKEATKKKNKHRGGDQYGFKNKEPWKR